MVNFLDPNGGHSVILQSLGNLQLQLVQLEETIWNKMRMREGIRIECNGMIIRLLYMGCLRMEWPFYAIITFSRIK